MIYPVQHSPPYSWLPTGLGWAGKHRCARDCVMRLYLHVLFFVIIIRTIYIIIVNAIIIIIYVTIYLVQEMNTERPRKT